MKIITFSLFFVAATVFARAPIDYTTLDASGSPPGTMVKLKKAAILAASGTNCEKVIGGSWIPVQDRDAGQLNKPYFISCLAKRGPVIDYVYNVYFSDNDINAGLPKNEAQPIATNLAITMCRTAIKQKLSFASSAKFYSSPTESGANGTPNQRIVWDYSVLNNYGNRVPERGVCIITPSGHVDITISGR